MRFKTPYMRHADESTACGRSCMALARDRGLEDNKRHMVATFEQAVRLMPPRVEGWVWFSDFHGFGLRDMSPSISSAFLGVHWHASPSWGPDHLKLSRSHEAPVWRSKAASVCVLTTATVKLAHSYADKASPRLEHVLPMQLLLL